MNMAKKICIMILAVMFILSGCGSKKLSQKEITVYTAIEDEFLQEYIESFNKQYPDIKVNIVRDSTGGITARLLAEKENPKADVIWGVAASSMLVIDKEQQLTEYVPKGMDKIDSKFIDKKNSTPHWVGINAWTGVITVNTEETKKKGLKIPKTYQDLLDPSYKNQIVMPNPGSSGTGFLMVSSWIQNMGEEKAWKFMSQLNKNIRTYVHSGAAPTKSTAQGEQVIGLGMDCDSVKEQKKTPEITTIFPQSGLPWDVEAVALMKNKNIKPEAKKFIDWSISKKAMDEYSKNRSIVTLKGSKSKIKGIPQNYTEKFTKNDLNWAAENRKRIIDEWNKRFSVAK